MRFEEGFRGIPVAALSWDDPSKLSHGVSVSQLIRFHDHFLTDDIRWSIIKWLLNHDSLTIKICHIPTYYFTQHPTQPHRLWAPIRKTTSSFFAVGNQTGELHRLKAVQRVFEIGGLIVQFHPLPKSSEA